MRIQAPGLPILSWEVYISVASCIYLKYPLSGLLIQKHARGHRNPFLCRPFSWCGLTVMVPSHHPNMFEKKKKSCFASPFPQFVSSFRFKKGHFLSIFRFMYRICLHFTERVYLTWMGLENWPAGFLFSFFFFTNWTVFGCESVSVLDSVHWVLKPLKTAVHHRRAFNPAAETTL